MIKCAGLSLVFLATLALSSANVSALSCVSAVSKIRKGKVVTTLSTVEREVCRTGEVPVLAGTNGAAGPTGAQGPQGAKGDSGAKGEPGPTLIRHTQNAESGWPITTSPTEVASIGDPTYYSGSYTSALVQPEGTVYMAVNVQAHVLNVTGTGVSCALEKRLNSGTWTTLAQTTVLSTEAFMNSSFPNFSAGSSLSFRIVCNTTSGSGTARGEIGVIAGIIS